MADKGHPGGYRRHDGKGEGASRRHEDMGHQGGYRRHEDMGHQGGSRRHEDMGHQGGYRRHEGKGEGGYRRQEGKGHHGGYRRHEDKDAPWRYRDPAFDSRLDQHVVELLTLDDRQQYEETTAFLSRLGQWGCGERVRAGNPDVVRAPPRLATHTSDTAMQTVLKS